MKPGDQRKLETYTYYLYDRLGSFLRLLAAAPEAVALTLLALDLPLMPLLLAVATRLLILLPGAPGGAIETTELTG